MDANIFGQLIAENFMRPTPVFKFLSNQWGKCIVPGCRQFANAPKKHRSRLCRKHRKSVKFSRLDQRNSS